ncbi:hypothetical protein OE88DRAFT_1666927 [Heliocybe sulcata]|uniref:PAS domain-containing protein n=1 Tax=Heliocybe sulcata TaxID=5364 RepID=A0A5C3MSK0_9AGAM|nr:hypothetical protein OE88DRAFT_1666927 [Heliocybe sulcata]
MASSMPFSKYFADAADRQDYTNDALGVDPAAFAGPVQFQMPQFMLGGPPTLAYGGGAEVLPAGMVNAPGSIASSWFSNNGFYVDQASSSASGSQSQPSLSKYYEQQPHSQSYQHAQARGAQQIRRQQRHSVSVYPHSNIVVQDRVQPNSGPLSPVLRPTYDPTRHRSSTYPPGTSPVESIPYDMGAPLASAVGSGIFPTMPIPSNAGIGLPLYSATGFDLLSLLSRIAQRPNPTITLGPVDMTCAFTIVDVRRYDSPIVYASPSFCSLTGYQEHEVIGRNCRFLQAPSGRVEKGDERKFTSPESVAHLRKNLVANKECQTSIVNYRKDGSAFINLVTAIPLYGGVNNSLDERDDVVYHVGFQVDLTEQPNAILQKVRDGSYVVNYSSNAIIPPPAGASARRVSGIATHAMSKDLRTLLASQAFTNSLPLTSSTTAPPAAGGPMDTQEGETAHPLNLVLLESTPDFIHVLSLKGSFLYVAPAVRKVLGYEPDELVGKFVSDYCHPADVVPLMRELKESSTGQTSVEGGAMGVALGAPKTVDLLFRAQAKWGGWVWVECRGRLHVEPGKGRKAIVLSGRARELPTISWGMVGRAGGLMPLPEGCAATSSEEGAASAVPDKEFWGMLSSGSTLLVAGAAVKEILGWSVGELIGRTIGDLLVSVDGARDEEMVRVLEGSVGRIAHGGRSEPTTVACWMSRKEGVPVRVAVVLYPSQGSRSPSSGALDAWASPSGSASCPVVCQVRIDDGQTATRRSMTHAANENVFAELTTATSWQYELQQLKFANQRILEDVEGLEAELGREEEEAPSVEADTRLQSAKPSSGVPGGYDSVRAPSLKRSHDVLDDHRGDRDYSWNSQMQYTQQQQLYVPSGRAQYTSNVRAEGGHGHVL